LRYPQGQSAATIYASAALNLTKASVKPVFDVPWTPFPYKCDICTNDTHYMWVARERGVAEWQSPHLPAYLPACLRLASSLTLQGEAARAQLRLPAAAPAT
jgi:hypothetical protein